MTDYIYAVNNNRKNTNVNTNNTILHIHINWMDYQYYINDEEKQLQKKLTKMVIYLKKIELNITTQVLKSLSDRVKILIKLY